MAYDGLDRLTAAVSPMQWGNATYAYDPLDNLREANQGARAYRYHYNGINRLDAITSPTDAPIYSFTYDERGNTTSKNTSQYVFDVANRLSQVAGSEAYRYDGLGRRVQTTDAEGKTTFWIYSQAGQVLYTSEARRSQNLSYIYLGNTQLATRAVAWGSGTTTIRYQHTDALGSPVAETDASGNVVKRNSFTPYGETFGATVIDGTGYTGHVMDRATGLTYMQQRYYDQQVGRFLSVDPVPTSLKSAENFARFEYAASSPLRFTDPDGREIIDSADEARKKYGAGTKGKGHHWIPFGATTRIDISSEARSIFGQAVSGEPLPTEEHLVDHPKYNDAVRRELTSYAKSNNIDLSKMTVAQATDFVAHIRKSQVPQIQSMVERVTAYTAKLRTYVPQMRGMVAFLIGAGMIGLDTSNFSDQSVACRTNPVCDAERMK
jgi:RHS repeat-associated protein